MSSAEQTTKKTKIKRALRSAARLPRVPYIRAGRANNNFTPRPGEPPVVVFRIQVLGCLNLLAKDRSGTSDAFIVVSVLNKKAQTPVAKKTLNPVYPAKDATFDFPIYLSLADKLGVVELVVWDKDMLKKDYLGEVSLPLEDWFSKQAVQGAYGFDQPGNTVISLNLVSTRANTPSAGSIQVKLGFAPTTNTNNLMEFDEIYGELVKRSRPSLVSAPPTEGVGTVRSNGPQYEDDGGLSSDPEESDDEGEFVDTSDDTPSQSGTPKLLDLYIPPASEATTPESSAHPSDTSATGVDLTRPGVGQIELEPVKPINLPELNILPSSPATPTPGNLSTPMPRFGIAEETPKAATGFTVPSPSTSSRFIPKKFVRKFSGLTGGTSSQPASPAVDVQGNLVPPDSAKKKRSVSTERRKFGRSWSSGSGSGSGSRIGTVSPSGSASGSDSGAIQRPLASPGKKRKKRDFEFKGSNDILGIVMLEIQSAEDLPRLANMTRTGWDMDPFVVISFGKRVFRTRVIRHSRNPVWDEKLLFHVRRYETSFKVQLAILDWDKLSANDLIGDVSFDVKQLIDIAPQPDPVTGLYAAGGEEGHEAGMTQFALSLSTAKETPWESKHNPVLKFRAKYQPYDALRQRFWRQYLKQYDTDNTGTLSHLEITAMLDSLGSTLTRSTVSSFFTRYGKQPNEEEITIEQVVMCLEEELGRPDSEKKRVDADDEGSVSATPVLMAANARGEELNLDLNKLDFSGPPHVAGMDVGQAIPGPQPYATEPNQMPLEEVTAPVTAADGPETPDTSSDDAEGYISAANLLSAPNPDGIGFPEVKKKRKLRFRRGINSRKSTVDSQRGTDKEVSEDTVSNSEGSNPVERVINVKNCPLCHRPRLNSKAEMDIITHLAICASQDWNKVDRIVVGNFVTASQAQRKWYSKIITKVSSGDYKLGANSANIIVQNRMTGQLEEEKMQVYVRLGIRLLYKGASSRMEGGRARKLLRSLSIKQGIKYDDPESAKEIPTFIDFHKLDVEEILDPLDSFRTFNQFFYRKLKPTARPVESPDDPYRLVSAADCRLMAFETVSEATRLWIKGREFTVARLLGDAYKAEADRYNGGALAIFRLAPQDYHRFHSPVDGKIGPMTYISGEYYTVNPQAIRTALDVYGENARKIVPIDSPQFGRVMAVCVGAMMVGSIHTTVEEGDYVKRGQEFGYFAFGGSTIVILFEKGRVEWDEDLLINGRASLETLVRVGMGIGLGKPIDP